LRRQAVRYVALSDSAPESWSASERTLVRRGPAYLEPVWHSAHWRVYRVRGALPLVQGPARLVRVTPSALTLRAERAGALVVRVRWTPYWDVPRLAGCVAPARGGWTHVRAYHPGLLTLQANFEPAAILDEQSGDC
jgi:hypothetical protein